MAEAHASRVEMVSVPSTCLVTSPWTFPRGALENVLGKLVAGVSVGRGTGKSGVGVGLWARLLSAMWLLRLAFRMFEMLRLNVLWAGCGLVVSAVLMLCLTMWLRGLALVSSVLRVRFLVDVWVWVWGETLEDVVSVVARDVADVALVPGALIGVGLVVGARVLLSVLLILLAARGVMLVSVSSLLMPLFVLLIMVTGAPMGMLLFLLVSNVSMALETLVGMLTADPLALTLYSAAPVLMVLLTDIR